MYTQLQYSEISHKDFIVLKLMYTLERPLSLPYTVILREILEKYYQITKSQRFSILLQRTVITSASSHKNLICLHLKCSFLMVHIQE